VDPLAAAIVLICLVALAADLARRWRHPALYVDPRSRVTWGVLAACAAAVLLVNVLD
jgi:hypothetical protein